MPKPYRVHVFKHGLKTLSDVVYGDTDTDAVVSAQEKFSSDHIEVWDGNRIVAKIDENE